MSTGQVAKVSARKSAYSARMAVSPEVSTVQAIPIFVPHRMSSPRGCRSTYRCLFAGVEATQQVMRWEGAHLRVNICIHRRVTQSGLWRRRFEGTSTALLHSPCAFHAHPNTCRQTGSMLSALWSTSVPSFRALRSDTVEKSTILTLYWY